MSSKNATILLFLSVKFIQFSQIWIVQWIIQPCYQCQEMQLRYMLFQSLVETLSATELTQNFYRINKCRFRHRLSLRGSVNKYIYPMLREIFSSNWHGIDKQWHYIRFFFPLHQEFSRDCGRTFGHLCSPEKLKRQWQLIFLVSLLYFHLLLIIFHARKSQKIILVENVAN